MGGVGEKGLYRESKTINGIREAIVRVAFIIRTEASETTESIYGNFDISFLVQIQPYALKRRKYVLEISKAELQSISIWL